MGAAALAAALAAGGAQAATFTYSTDFSGGVGAEWAVASTTNTSQAGILGQLGDGTGTATLTRSSVGASAANAGTLTFDLLGFRSIDGHNNSFRDTFSLIVNGVTIFQGAFDMNGGGGDSVYVNTGGASYTVGDHIRTITTSFTALAGVNTFAFQYANLQGFGDEAWGLDNVSFGAAVADPTPTGPGVPEPATWAMLILGFGATGTVLRSRRRTALA
jgi:hypothetical protein